MSRVIAIEEAWATAGFLEAFHDIPESQADFDVVRTRIFANLPRFRAVIEDTAEGRLQRMDEAGVDVAILSLMAPGVQCFGAEEGTRLARETNDALYEAVQASPDRFGALASIAPQDPEAAADEVRRACGELGFNGVIINGHTQRAYLDEPLYAPILAAIEETGLPLYLHPRSPPVEFQHELEATGPHFEKTLPWIRTPGGGLSLKDAMWGFTLEPSLNVVRMLVSGVFERHPDLKLVVGHMGEGLPGLLYRLDWAGKTGFDLPRLPSDVFRSNIWITTSSITDTEESRLHLEFCVRLLGAERILFACDYPFGDMAEMVKAMHNAELDPVDRAKIFGETTAELFRFD